MILGDEETRFNAVDDDCAANTCTSPPLTLQAQDCGDASPKRTLFTAVWLMWQSDCQASRDVTRAKTAMRRYFGLLGRRFEERPEDSNRPTFHADTNELAVRAAVQPFLSDERSKRAIRSQIHWELSGISGEITENNSIFIAFSVGAR